MAYNEREETLTRLDNNETPSLIFLFEGTTMMRRLFKNRAFQVTLVDKPGPTYLGDPEQIENINLKQTAEVVQDTIVVAAVAIGSIVILKTICQISILTVKAAFRI